MSEKFKWYSVKEIAQLFNVKHGTVRSWVCRKSIPAPDIRTPRFTRWKAQTIEPFLEDPIKWRKHLKQGGSNEQ